MLAAAPVAARGPRIDYGAPPGSSFFPGVIVRALVEQAGFGGVYNDVFAGSGANLAYDPPPPYPRQHEAHGGDYWMRGKGRALDLERDVLRTLGPGGDRERRRRSFLFSEVAEEFVAPHLDGFQDSYDWAPGHLSLAEETIYGPVISPPDVPLDAKDMAMPLWATVYHEWAPAFRFAMALSTVGLARGGGGKRRPGYPGMSGGEWRDLVCFLFGLNFVSGLGVNFVDYLNEDAPPVRERAGELTVDRDVDPEGEGLVVSAFLARLFAAQAAAVAGRFCRQGRLLRPLAMAATSAARRRNPVAACPKTPPELAPWCYPYFYPPVEYGNAFGLATLDFPVAMVLHSVWGDALGDVGVLLVNWTADAGRWMGVFDPELYGFRRDAELVLERAVAGEAARRVASFRGSVALAIGGSVHGELPTVDLGALAAHDVALFSIHGTRAEETMEVIGRHIAVEGPTPTWQSEPIDLGWDNAVRVTVLCLATDGFNVFPELWGSNQRGAGFELLVTGDEELTTEGQTVEVAVGPVGVRYVQLRFLPGSSEKGVLMVVGAMAHTSRR